MGWIRHLTFLVVLFATSSLANKCDVTIIHKSGTTINLDLLDCPGIGDAENASYCCGTAWHPICCTEEEFEIQGNASKLISQQQTIDQNLLNNIKQKKIEVIQSLIALSNNATQVKKKLGVEMGLAAKQAKLEKVGKIIKAKQTVELDPTTPLSEQEINDQKLLTDLEDKIAELSKIRAENNNGDSLGEKCSRTITHPDGTIVNQVYATCPGPKSPADALFCCPAAASKSCCTAEELINGQTKKAKVTSTENPTTASGQQVQENGEESNSQSLGDEIADEIHDKVQTIVELAKGSSQKDLVVKVLGAGILIFIITVFLSWYCCVRKNRKRGYQFIGVIEPNLKKPSDGSKFTLFKNIDQEPQQLKKHLLV